LGDHGRVDYDARTDTVAYAEGITRLVVLGDPHGALIALDEVLQRERRPDTAFVSVGDNVGYADADSCSHLCAIFEQLGVASVYGNHEDWSEDGTLFMSPSGLPRQLTPEAVAWLESLPFRLRIEAASAPDLVIGVVHSFGDWTYVKQDSVERFSNIEDTQITFCGHSHRPAIWILERGKDPVVRRLNPRSKKGVEVVVDPAKRYVVDAGSLGRPSFGGGRVSEGKGTYAVLDLSAGTLALRLLDLTARIKAMLERMTRRPEEPS
jgi:predicted phosphodiesterase